MPWESLTPAFNAWSAFVAGHAPEVARGARLAYFVLAALLLAALFRTPAGSTSSRSPRGPAVFWYVALALVAVLVYQATWQLAGFARPEFIAFMRAHNHRPASAAGGHARGRILDRQAVVLAVDDPATGGRRTYPLGSAFAHSVGYDNAIYGQSGIEAADDAALCGAGPEALADLKAFSQRMLDHTQSGASDLRLTLDARLQSRALKLLGNRPGAVVGIRPSDGAILILASSPSFDPNQVDPARYNRLANSPMFDRALRGRYAPGSTFKIITACKAAEVGFTGQFNCPAEGFTPAGTTRPIRDHEYFESKRNGTAWLGQGTIGLDKAFARSSNVFFARLGSQLGAAALDDIAVRFCFNRKTPIFIGSSGELAADASTFPNLASRPASETAQVAIGQGQLAVTPLQMALVTAAIANKGLMMTPHCRATEAPVVLRKSTTPAAAKRVAQLMRECVVHGTGRGASVKGIDIAGKTGTAQKGTGEKDDAWFVCFAPYQKPELALAVIVENGGFGAQTAVPIAVELMRLAANQGWSKTAAATNAAGSSR